jgi:hypothetical protein
MSVEVSAIDIAKAELFWVADDLRKSIDKWESRTGLQLTEIYLDRIDTTPASSPISTSILAVRCAARIVGESR